jgi:hypothetical protein
VLQVLVDADNVHRSRVAAVLSALPTEAVVVASGSPELLARVPWPDGTLRLPRSGWQRADLELAAAYQPDSGPLVLVSGDGDFAQLAARHGGHVLVVSEAPSARLRAVATTLDPVHDGVAAIRDWLNAARSPGPPPDEHPGVPPG